MSCSRLASGDAVCISAPTSSSASVKSLCLMSTPLTRAITGSAAAKGSAEDEESFEQPDAIGSANMSVAIVANAIAHREGADRGGELGQTMGVVLG